jgi:hypothetical protein
VLPAELPDGLILAWRAGRERPEIYVIEVLTYSYPRVAEQALRDLMLVYLKRGEVPNVLILVLRPRGQVRVRQQAVRSGSDGLTALEGRGGWSSSGPCPPSRSWRRRTRG